MSYDDYESGPFCSTCWSDSLSACGDCLDTLKERIKELEETLRSVRIGCPTVEEEARKRYGDDWRNELIDKVLTAKGEENERLHG